MAMCSVVQCSDIVCYKLKILRSCTTVLYCPYVGLSVGETLGRRSTGGLWCNNVMSMFCVGFNLICTRPFPGTRL